MAFQLSPGINVTESDLTTIVPSVATSIGAFAGKFAWGPVDQVVTISDELRLVDRFGKPDINNYEYWFTAANFLSYANNLKTIRSANIVSTFTATANVDAQVLIKNDDDWENNFSVGSTGFGEFAARYPGDMGNSLKVSIADSSSYNTWTYKTEFQSAPNTSDFVSNKGGSDDELHIIVIDEDGRFTGVRGSVLEKYAFTSKASDARDESGNSSYYKNVIESKSKYIHWMEHPLDGAGSWGINASDIAYTGLTSNVTVSLSGGADGNISSGNLISSYDMFSNAETVDISLMLTGPADETIIESLISIAESRKDCVVFVSPEKSDVVDNAGSEVTDIVAFRNTLTSTSYAVLDSNWKYQYDKYNDVYRWIPLNGDIAGLCARTDQERDPWFSPGGLNRGIIKNVIKTAWNPNKTDRDDLYVNGVNPVVTFQGEGTVLFGDKTLQAKPSAFDRINVRRLFIVLEKAIAKASRYSLFEFNDQFTRAQFVSMVEPFLRDVQGRRGITDFRVICDDTNNTGEVIDRNEFIGDIYIKPARSINFIQLNFVAVRSGVSFDEVVGRW
ncbi:phage tail sheath subtilisin-like domain-containing protein [Candidatus Dojkabacteria bacterium]|jgi:phage tail sheath protein FI|nr:phage tail sheath subtilisin-like domain-containing protein [Candidatus Dojkabacteria bacterium]